MEIKQYPLRTMACDRKWERSRTNISTSTRFFLNSLKSCVVILFAYKKKISKRERPFNSTYKKISITHQKMSCLLHLLLQTSKRTITFLLYLFHMTTTPIDIKISTTFQTQTFALGITHSINGDFYVHQISNMF